MLITRRHSLGLLGAAAGTLILPRRPLAQGGRRSITVAVQKISNNNTLDIWHEQSNVGERVFFPNLWEGLILRDWMGIHHALFEAGFDTIAALRGVDRCSVWTINEPALIRRWIARAPGYLVSDDPVLVRALQDESRAA